MAKCTDCTNFFAVLKDADDYAQGKGDCVNEKQDEKGKYWLSKPVTEDTARCPVFQQRQ